MVTPSSPARSVRSSPSAVYRRRARDTIIVARVRIQQHCPEPPPFDPLRRPPPARNATRAARGRGANVRESQDANLCHHPSVAAFTTRRTREESSPSTVGGVSFAVLTAVVATTPRIETVRILVWNEHFPDSSGNPRTRGALTPN